MGGAPPRPGGRPQEPPLQVVVGVGGGCVTGGGFFASLKNDRGQGDGRTTTANLEQICVYSRILAILELGGLFGKSGNPPLGGRLGRAHPARSPSLQLRNLPARSAGRPELLP